MLTSQMVAEAQQRLIDRFGTATERRNRLHPPQPGDLIRRVVSAAASPKPTADGTDLRSAMALVAADRWATDSRELNLITLARQSGLSWREIAWHLGLDSAQSAQQRHQRLARTPDTVIYAFRLADEKGAPWHGNPGALPGGKYETGTIDFNPARPGPFSGRTLEVRYGPVDADYKPSYLRAYALVNNRRIAATADVQEELFGG
jgi:hypothetical protein